MPTIFSTSLPAIMQVLADETPDPGFPIWGIILITAAVVVVALLVLVFTFKKKK